MPAYAQVGMPPLCEKGAAAAEFRPWSPGGHTLQVSSAGSWEAVRLRQGPPPLCAFSLEVLPRVTA